MSPAVVLAVFAAAVAIGWAADRIDRIRARRAPAPAPAPAPEPPAPAAHRDPPRPRLTPIEQSHLALLAARYACSDPAAGRTLADYLRTRCPGITDTDLMRCVIALGHAARYFHRHDATDTDAFARLLHAMAGAALDLTALDRDETPR